MAWGNDKDDNKSPWGKKPINKNEDDFEEFIRGGQEKFKKMFSGGGSGGGNPMPTGFAKSTIGFIAGVIAVLWLTTGFYTVNEGEQAAVLRFGEFVRVGATGLNYHLPAPIEKIEKRRVDLIEREEIGFRANGDKAQPKNIPEESLMLTGDENIVDINFVIQWKISDIKNFLFNVNEPQKTVKASSESALREVIAATPISDALAGGKLEIERKGKESIQEILDSYKAGVEIVNVQMLKADPPVDVIDAFRDVQTARADKEREINQAEAYTNDIIPRARGEAEQILQEAEAYKQEVIAKAQGESSRFIAVYDQYKMAKDVTKKRIYLETMESMLNGMDKVILDGSKAVPYLPLSEVKQEKKGN